MGKGRLVLDVYKDHPADPFFWILLENVSDPHKVYYGRENWSIELSKKETRAKYTIDRHIQESRGARVIGSIDISGPTDEIIRLIEFAGYHGCGGTAKPGNIFAPRKTLGEVMQHLATLELQRALRDDNDRCLKEKYHDDQYISATPGSLLESQIKNRLRVDWVRAYRPEPLDRPTRYDQGAYAGEFLPIAGRHTVINVTPLDNDTHKLAAGEPIEAILISRSE